MLANLWPADESIRPKAYGRQNSSATLLRSFNKHEEIVWSPPRLAQLPRPFCLLRLP